LRADPIGLAGGINLFQYAENDPVNRIDPWGLKEWTIHRYGAGASLAIVSLSGQRLQFISNCENNQRTIKTYLVFGVGLTVGLKVGAFGGADKEDQTKGYFGNTTIKDDPNPKWGMAVSGPSAGIIAGGTLASAQLDFNNNYSEIYGATTGKSLGASIFNAEVQRYFYLGEDVERCCENEN